MPTWHIWHIRSKLLNANSDYSLNQNVKTFDEIVYLINKENFSLVLFDHVPWQIVSFYWLMMALHVWKNSIFFRAVWAQNSGFILLNKVEQHPNLFVQFSNINIENNCFGFARLPWAGHPLFRCIIFSMFHDDKSGIYTFLRKYFQ